MDISNCAIWLKHSNASIWVKKVSVCVCAGEGWGGEPVVKNQSTLHETAE